MMRKAITISFILVSLVSSLALFSQTAEASTAGFKPGQIMDDGIMTKSNSMSTTQIQNFLNSKVPSCDTYGTQPSEFGGGTRAQWAAARGYNPPFTCLRNYSEGGRLAAKIIYDVAQKYRINPQSLIILLQKEQGLVTDTWPLSTQYRTATGYGCPDTAPCDSQYYGLTNQLDWSAKMFRSIIDQNPNWYSPYFKGANPRVYWHPDTARCGSQPLDIKNWTTASLYSYTPYRPNQAALNAGYGTGDGCSSYGNRNFYSYFTDWFGSTMYMYGNRPASSTSYANSPCTITGFGSGLIGRLYNPDTSDFLYTTSKTEACNAIRYGYIWDGAVMKNASGAGSIPIYRLSDSERHLYTSSSAVRDDYINNKGYKSEGIGFYTYGSSAQGRIPVYGLQNGKTFFITSSGREAVLYQSNYEYHNFGVIFYTEQINSDKTPVYRISRNNSRLYTTSAAERSIALSNLGFKDEGIVSNNDASPNDGNLPVYRLRSPTGGYVYTTNRIERDLAVINYSHYSEGISFYSLLWSNSPVFRATKYSNLMRIYTSSEYEYSNAAKQYGYKLEGVGWYSY